MGRWSPHQSLTCRIRSGISSATLSLLFDGRDQGRLVSIHRSDCSQVVNSRLSATLTLTPG